MSDNTAIPDEVQVGSGSSAWRIAGGAICKGREIEGTYESRKQVVGYLRRIGVHYGNYDDGTRYGKLEADFETSRGVVNVGVSITNDGNDTCSVGAITYAEALCLCEGGELIAVTANEAAKPNKHGKFSTYSNLHKVTPVPGSDPAKFVTVQIRPERVDGEMLERLRQCIAILSKKSCWGPRPAREDATGAGADAGWFELVGVLAKKGWPKLTDAESAYVAWAAKITGGVPQWTTLVEVADGAWAKLAGLATGMKTCPKPIVEEAAKAAPKQEPFDPFADE